MKPKHETKHCQRCGKGFECKSGSILLCQCQSVVLNQAQLEYIGSRYYDCLCAACLLAVRGEFNQLQHNTKVMKIANDLR